MQKIENIPKHWQVKQLGEECKCITGTTPPKKEVSNYGNEIPFVKPPQLFDKSINDAPEKLSKKGAVLARILPIDSVLVTCIGNLGRTAINKIPVAFNQQINAIIPSKNLNGRFLFYQAQSLDFKNQLEGLSSATTIAIVNKSKFETIEVIIPPLSEQQAIVAKIEELFSDLENGKQQLLTAQLQLKTYRQSLLKWAFEGKLSNKGVKDDELPQRWKMVDLKSITDYIQYGYTESSSKDAIGPRLLRITDIKGNRVVWDDVPYCKIDLENKKKYLLNDGDLVFARTGATVGKSFLIKGKIPEAVFASYLIRVRVNNISNENYLFYFFQSPNYWAQIKKEQVGIGQPNVNGTKLGNLKIPISPFLEQQLIVDELESKLTVCDKIEETISQSLQQAETLKQSILKKAFEGKLI